MIETEQLLQWRTGFARKVAMDLAKRGIVAGKEVAWQCYHGEWHYGEFIRVSPSDANAKVRQNGAIRSIPPSKIELAETARQEAANRRGNKNEHSPLGYVIGIACCIFLAFWLYNKASEWLTPPPLSSAEKARIDRIYRSQFRSEQERLDFEAGVKAEEEMRRGAWGFEPFPPR
jgi:hypothetical protein